MWLAARLAGRHYSCVQLHPSPPDSTAIPCDAHLTYTRAQPRFGNTPRSADEPHNRVIVRVGTSVLLAALIGSTGVTGDDCTFCCPKGCWRSCSDDGIFFLEGGGRSRYSNDKEVTEQLPHPPLLTSELELMTG